MKVADIFSSNHTAKLASGKMNFVICLKLGLFQRERSVTLQMCLFN